MSKGTRDEQRLRTILRNSEFPKFASVSCPMCSGRMMLNPRREVWCTNVSCSFGLDSSYTLEDVKKMTTKGEVH